MHIVLIKGVSADNGLHFCFLFTIACVRTTLNGCVLQGDTGCENKFEMV